MQFNGLLVMIIFLHSNFTMHADRPYIAKIPIAKPSLEQRRAVEASVDRLSCLTFGESQYWQEYEQLNHRLYEIYQLSKGEISLIEETLASVMSVKSNG